MEENSGSSCGKAQPGDASSLLSKVTQVSGCSLNGRAKTSRATVVDPCSRTGFAQSNLIIVGIILVNTEDPFLLHCSKPGPDDSVWVPKRYGICPAGPNTHLNVSRAPTMNLPWTLSHLVAWISFRQGFDSAYCYKAFKLMSGSIRGLMWLMEMEKRCTTKTNVKKVHLRTNLQL